MKILILCGDIIQVAEVRDAICEVLEKHFTTKAMPLNYDSEHSTYVVETKRGTNTNQEKRVYILPDRGESFEYPQRLERLARRLADKLSLDRSQVVCASFFPG